MNKYSFIARHENFNLKRLRGQISTMIVYNKEIE